MFPADNINPLIKELVSRLGNVPGNDGNPGRRDQKERNGRCDCGGNGSTANGSGSGSGTGSKNVKVGITPAQALIIAGILGGALDVLSVLVDKNQAIEIVLTGSLKEKTQLEKMIDQIGNMPFDDVMKAVIDRLSY